jgi:hypothetical protein
MQKLDTFLTTGGAGNPGWTAEDADGSGNSLDTTNGVWAISKAGSGSQLVQIAAQWDTGTPDNLGLYQYYDSSGVGNYVRANNPWGQIKDSGNGYAGTSNSNLDDERHAPIENSPLQYWAFTGDTYAHIVVEIASGEYVHFGFGILDMFNDWTGGEYCYGQRFQGGVGTDVALQDKSTHLLDATCKGTSSPDMAQQAATLRCEGMTDSPAGGLWAVCMGNQGASDLGNDRQSTPKGRIHVSGGFRAHSHALMFGSFAGTITQGLIPTYPIVAYHWDRDISGSSTMVDSIAPLGAMKDVRGINIRNFNGGDEVTIGSDTWVVFPSLKKGESGGLTNTTGYQGIMYKKST